MAGWMFWSITPASNTQQPAEKQLADMDSLITQGANAILIFAHDGESI